jgi:PEGA domain
MNGTWRKWVRWGRFGGFTLLFLLARVEPSIAETSDRAEALIRRGVELRKAGHDDQALDAFRSSYQTKPTPRALAQMGMAEQALGRWVDGERDLKGALTSPTDPWIARNLVTLKKSLATVSGHLGSVQIVGTPAGARVVLDEREVGKLPLEIAARAPAGEVMVTVSASGFADISRKVIVVPGGLVREVIALHAVGSATTAPTPRAKEAAAGDDGEGPTLGAGARSSTESDAPAEPGSRLTGTQYFGITAGVVGAAAAGVGTFFLLRAMSKNNDSQPRCPQNYCDDQGAQLRREAITAGDRATVALIVAGVLAAGGITMFLVGRPAADSASTARITPVVAPDRFAMVGTVNF